MAGGKNGGARPRKNGRGNGNGNGGRRRNGGARTNAASVQAQGVGAVTRSAFGSRAGVDLRVWDAKLPMHLPLPRAVGPYLVMRTTMRFESNSKAECFGTFKYKPSSTYGGGWSTICDIHAINSTLGINAGGNSHTNVMPLDGLGLACTLVPSAFSVQMMNPNALTSTAGIIYAGCMNTQAAIAGRAESWDGYFSKFIEFQNPRLISAGNMALRGKQINSYPLNMSELADFTTIEQDVEDLAFTWSPASNNVNPTGFAPILVYNPSEVNIEYLVTTEWRVRFDLDNPASSAHQQHSVATDQLWSNLMARATSLGNGVLDIADVVSNVGQIAQQYKPLLAIAMK